MVKFVESDSTGLPLKRKQVAQACLSCRRRKKRCIHEGGHQSTKDEIAPLHQDAVSPPKQHAASLNVVTLAPARTPCSSVSVSASGANMPAESPRSQESQGRASRFVGDLNPEHLLIEATSPHSARDLSVRGGIGVWQSRPSQTHHHDARPPQLPRSLLPGPGLTLQHIIASHVQSHCLSCVPVASDWAVLRTIYFDKLDPLFPALRRHRLTELGHDGPAAVVAKQVICIAAAADPEATRHLRLRHAHENLLTRQEFVATLSAAVQATLDSGLLTDRVLIIRILVIFSMYMQPTSPEEADLPTLVFAKAVNQMHTLGLQLPANDSNDDYDQLQSLFLCVWALDRLNAAFYGRATLLHERDIGWNIDKCIAKQPPASQFFLMVIRLLDNVIGLYRPSQRVVDEPMHIDLPINEQMIIDAGATKVPSALLATAEVLYHSVAILSCRYPPGGLYTALPSRATNSRRSHSADRILSIIRDEFAGHLSHMPILPYAVSLSLSVAYRKMRYSKVPMFRHRGRRSFVENTALLKAFGDMFWTAKTMAAMAEQVLQEMDKAMVLAQETTTTTGGVDSSNANEVRGDDDDDEDDDVNGSDDAEPRGQKSNTCSTTVVEPQTVSSVGGGSVFFRGGSGTYDGTAIFETAPEFDVFEQMNPSFNLGAVDAALEGNLDIGTSSNWFTWQQTWGIAEDSRQRP